MGFSERLKAERLKKGLKQKELADMVKTTNTSVSNWEKGISRPSAGAITLLARALEISPFDLLGKYSLHDLREVNSKDPSERSFEDSMALTFSVDLLKAASIDLNNMISDTIRNIKDLNFAIPQPDWNSLLGEADKQLLFAFNILNDGGKALLLEYLTGLLRVPTYLQETEYGIDEELIADLNATKENLRMDG